LKWIPLSGYKSIKAPEEPLPDNIRFVLDKPKPIVEFRPFGTALAGIPSSYDTMALGYVTPVKHQMSCGSCWIFAAIADFESDVAIGESSLFDFSEQQVGDCNIWSDVNDFCNGGDAFITTNYFTKYGSSDEACHPYEETQGTCEQCPILKNVDNWRIITWADGNESEYIATIKNAIFNYGPVFSTIYSNDSGFNSYSGGVYEYWGSEETDHAIEIIGWNDSLSHSKGTGAWLIKNSWGTSWGASGPYPGCAWVAYGAANIGVETSAISSYINPGDTKFYHDEGGWDGWCWGYDSPIAYGAVRFEPSIDSSLRAVDFWAVDTNMNYEIKIFDTLNNLGDGNYSFGIQLGNTQTGTINEEGYYSIPLDTPVSLTSGDDFIIQIKFVTTTGWGWPLPIEDNSIIGTFSDESFSSSDGLQFEKSSLSDIGIRARTVATAYNTPIGTDVQVEIPEIDAIITFTNVIKSGQTYLNEFNDDPAPPAGYNVLSNYYDIVTTAEYNGDITICIDYDDSEAIDEDKIKILHYDDPEIFAFMQENISEGYTVWDLNGTTYPDVLYEGSSESLHFVIDGTRLEINQSNFEYNTSVYAKNGERFIAWLAEPMFVIESAGDWYLSELIVDEDDDDKHVLRVGETLTLPKGFAITPLEIDVDGKEAWFSVTQDGEEVENVVVDEDQQFRYETDLNESGDDDNWVLTFWVESVIADMNTNLVKINSIQLLDDDDLFTDFEIKSVDNDNALVIELDASDDTIDLKRDGIVNLICDKFRFKLDENGDTGGVLKRPDATGTNIICGVVTNLSDFVIAEPIIDTMPTAILAQPEEGAYIRGTIEINGTANDANFYNYSIEWKNTTVDWTEIHNSTVPVYDGTLATWNTDNLEDGGYSIRLTVTDNTYNSIITQINVTIDNTLPTAILIQPEEVAFIRGTIDINGTANDTNFYNYTIQWKNTTVDWTKIHNSTVPVSDGTLATCNTNNLEDGDYSIRLTVADNAFNLNMTLINVTIDNTLPTVILIQPEEGAFIRGTIDINGTANDTNFYNYTIQWKNTTVDWIKIHNSTVPVSDGTLATWNTNNLEDGDYSIKLTVTDDLSNSNITLINVTIDNTLPTAILIQPEEGAYIRRTIDIIGTANDTNFKNYLTEWKNESVDWTEIKNSTVFVSDGTIAEWDTISLEDGDYTIKLTVNDNAFNSNMTLINVIIDNTPPEVSNVTAQPYIVNISGYTNITADVSDLNVSDVSARITYPNDTYLLIDMYNSSSHIYYHNFSNTTDPGRYKVTIIANDTTGNVNDTQKTSFVVAHIYNTPITTNASNSTFINDSGMNITLELFTKDNVTGSINITRSIVNITNDLDVPGPGIYVRINASTNFSNDNYSNLSWAMIKVNYTDKDVINLVESSLRLYWYESSGNWIKLETNSPTWVYGSGVNTAKNYVWANVSHFSDYALGGLEKETPSPSNGDGGGSGGGGGASGELYENIICSETDRQYVYQNSDISYSFDLDCNIVQYVNFTGLTSAGRIATKVEILNDTSTLVDNPPSDIVYKNMNIWVGNAGWATERNIEDATVVFTVEKSWITANNIDEPSIALYRYSDDTWHKLVTRKISEDANSLQFEAETPGFSPFAVTGKTIGEPRGEGIVEPTVTAELEPDGGEG